jgi:hypothetical protein
VKGPVFRGSGVCPLTDIVLKAREVRALSEQDWSAPAGSRVLVHVRREITVLSKSVYTRAAEICGKTIEFGG